MVVNIFVNKSEQNQKQSLISSNSQEEHFTFHSSNMK